MRFFLRRLAFYAITLWAAVTINFVIPRIMPGDPVSALIAKNQGRISTDAAASLRTLFGLDEQSTLWDQYVDYWRLLLSGDLGIVLHVLPDARVGGDRAGAALDGGPRRHRDAHQLHPRHRSSARASAGAAARGPTPCCRSPPSSRRCPYFWLALIAIAIFSVTLGWFPASGSYNRNLVPEWSWEFVGSVIYYGTLPAITIVVASVAGWMLGMRNMMVTVSSEDYVTVAHAKGLTERRVLWGYAARNSILPQISSFALSLGFIVGGTLVMEIVFSYQGIGYFLFTAVAAKDYPLMQGIFLVITIAVLVANIAADFAYGVLDPRTRQEG